MNWTAQSIGDLFAARLRQGQFKGRIHSIFSTIVNIEEAGILYTLGKPKIGKGPLTIFLASSFPLFDNLELKIGEMVKADEEKLQISQVLINLKDVEIYESTRGGSLPVSFELLRYLKAFVLKEGDLRGLGGLLRVTEGIPAVEEVIIEQAWPTLLWIKESLKACDPLFWNHLQKLIGLGPGLTPAGDDFLTGLLFVLHYLEKAGYYKIPKQGRRTFEVKVKQATNLISASQITLALQGRPFELIDHLLQNLFSAVKTPLTINTLQLLDCGSTSGTDILTGVIFALEIFQDITYHEV